MKDAGLINGKWFDAEVVSATPGNGVDLSGGVDIRLRLLEIRRVIDWSADAAGAAGDLHSLVTIAHYLGCSYRPGEDFDPKKMIGKLCCIKVQIVTENCRKRLEIVRMLYHMGSEMRAENGQLVGFIRL